MDTSSDLKTLHANIFGEDDSDDEPQLSHAAARSAAAAADDDDDEGDGRAAAILEGSNNLLMSGAGKKSKGAPKEKKPKEKKEKPSSGRGSKRKSAPDAEELAAAGLAREQKRLKKEQDRVAREAREAERAARIAAGEDVSDEEPAPAEGAAGAGAGDDPDSDSVDGDEAIEEGSKKDIFARLKGTRGKIEFNQVKLREDVQELQQRMEEAAEEDDDAVRAEPPRPALNKVAMLPDVESIMRKRQYHEVMIDHGMLSTLARWLRPMHDGNLVGLEVRTGLLNGLLRFDVDETVLGALRSSGIGKYVKLLSLHKRETRQNQRVALQLVEKWSRPIFQTSDQVKAQDLPMAQVPTRRAARPADAEMNKAEMPFGQGAGLDRETGNHARVPRPMGMDFQMLPASSAQPLPSNKYAKDSIKGRLQDRILGSKKKVVAQAVALSVEGRQLDRMQ